MLFVPGYRRDPAHRRTQKPVQMHLDKFASQAVPDTFSLRQYECPILDQGRTGSCGAGGTAQGLSVACNAMGSPLGFIPSPEGIYAATRAKERADQTPAGATLPVLTDSGVMPADVMAALVQWGIRPMVGPTPDGRNYDIWSSDDLTAAGIVGDPNVNDDPKLEELEKSGLKLVTGEYRIDETAPNLDDLVKQTLAVTKAPIGDGTFVDSQVMNFLATSAPVGAPNFSDPNGGGHWTCIVGYRLETDGSTSYEVVNSWGKLFGDAGHFWGTSAWLRACTDLYAWTVTR